MSLCDEKLTIKEKTATIEENIAVAPYNVVIMGDNTYDNGDQLELNCSSEGRPDLEYSWNRTNTFSATTTTNTSTLTISDLATVDGGEYTCTVNNDAGSSSTTVTVYIAPYNVVIMGDNTYDNGDQLELNCSSEGGPDLEYSWSRTNAFLATTTTNTSTLTISDLATVDGGDYTCTVTNDAGTSMDTITVYVAPYNVVIMGDNTYDNGDQLELNCSSEGGPDLEYSWSRTNTFSATTTTNTSTLTISDLATVDGGDYTCTVTNDAGTSNRTITVYVNESRGSKHWSSAP
ncbi:peroxidasin homolog [Dysidea avara]|uniref:peroxidasin homolog n=1 Tax=Dysidea avara TaxID=196820 RepID=UPI0033327B88